MMFHCYTPRCAQCLSMCDRSMTVRQNHIQSQTHPKLLSVRNPHRRSISSPPRLGNSPITCTLGAMTHTKTRRGASLLLALLTLAVTFGLFTGTASAGAALGARTTTMAFAGGTPTTTQRTICAPLNLGSNGQVFVKVKLMGASRADGTFSLKVKKDTDTTWDYNFTAVGDVLERGERSGHSPGRHVVVRAETIGVGEPDVVGGCRDGGTHVVVLEVEVPAFAGVQEAAGTPTNQYFTTCNTDSAYNNEIAQVSVNSASVGNGNFQLKLKEHDIDMGEVQLDTWTSAPDGFSTGTTKNGDCFDWVLRNGYVGATVPAVTYNVTFYFGP